MSRRCSSQSTLTRAYGMRRLAYSVNTSPSIFQATMDKILSGIENVMCIIDDILVIGDNEAEHLKTLNLVLERLEQHRVTDNVLYPYRSRKDELSLEEGCLLWRRRVE